MNNNKYTVRIENEKFGTLLNETFIDQTQFKLFLKMINGCLSLSNDLTFFNGTDWLVNIPYRFLKDSIVLTNTEYFTVSDMIITKSKMETQV
jgi:hypothetical protein